MSVYPYFNYGVAPYMNSRVYTGAAQSITGDIGFAANADIVITWLDDGTNPALANGIISIYAHNRWGTDDNVIDHRLYVFAKYAALPAPIITVPVKEFLNAGNAGANPQYSIAYVSGAGQQGYWTNYGGIWYRIVQATNHGIVNVYANLNPAVPGIPPTGIDATKYSISVRQSDLNYIATQQPKPEQNTHVPALFPSSGRYDLCWMNNSLHSQLHDAAFYIMPDGFREYDEIPDRTELNSRVAGEKALYEDEFLTAGQIEGSANVTLRWRNLDGSLTGYSTDAAKGGNLVIEATGGGGGTSNVEGRTYGPFHTNPAATIYYDETTATIRFQDEPLWYTDAMVSIADTKLPIQFDLIGDPLANPTTSIIRARAVNNNLHCSVTPLSGINYYPMALANAPVLDDYTVNHIRFVDTQNITWNVLGDVMPTLMPDGSTAVRQGIIINPVLNGLYVNWNVRSGNHQYFNSGKNIRQVISNDPEEPLPPSQMSTFSVDSLDTVDFWGKNGVVCTLIGATNNRLQVVVDRKLTIEGGSYPPLSNTTYIRFDSNIGAGTLNTGGSIRYNIGINDPNVDINYIGFNDLGSYTSRLPALPITFSVHDGLDSAGWEDGVGAKTIRGFYPRQTGRFSSQWSKSYNLNDNYRTVSAVQPILEVGFWGWNDANSSRNIICSNARFDSPLESSIYAARIDPLLIGAPDGYALSMSFDEGLYQIDVTVQGIMGMNPGNQPFNPIISQALHLHLFARPQNIPFPDVLQSKVLQSLDVMKNYTVVPYIANQPGQDTHTWYRQANASRPWSMQGSGLFWLRGLEHISTVLTLNTGGYNNEFYYQVCYVKMSCVKVANVADIHTHPKKIDVDSDPTMYNYAPQRWHDMIFY